MTYSYQIPKYDPVVPKAVFGEAEPVHPVAIVGGGVVGLSAAACLAARNIPVVVLDDDNTVGVRGMASRGVCYAHRTLQILDRVGTYDKVRAKGVTWETARVLYGDDLLYSYDLPIDTGDPYPPFVNIQQFYLEQYLVERLQEIPHAEIRWNNKVTALTQDAETVTLDVETKEGPYQLKAQYVIACDGANSDMRNAMGLTVTPKTTDDTWLIVDFHLDRDMPHERWTWIENPHNENRAVWFHQLADNVWRLDCQIGDASKIDYPLDETTAKRLISAILADIPGAEGAKPELAWVGPWTYRTHVMDDFRHGRVFFAGDAAHLKSPFGARGGNSGIQDVDNLAWKLEMVLNGKASEALLDTYNIERRAAAHENVAVTTRTSRFMFPRNDFEFDLRADAVKLVSHAEMARPLVNAGRMSVANEYDSSAALLEDRSECQAMPTNLRPGRIAVDGTVRLKGSEEPLLKHTGAGFSLFYFLGDTPLADKAIRAGLIALQASDPAVAVSLVSRQDQTDPDFPVLVDSNGAIHKRYGAKPGTAYLLRPDMHVGWRGQDATASDYAGLIPNILGAKGKTAPPKGSTTQDHLATSQNMQDPDAFYEALLQAQEGAPRERADAMMRQLVFILANQVGNAGVLKEAVNLARKAAKLTLTN